MRIIPEELKVLAKAAVEFFGSKKDVILMEVLIKYDCMKEKDLEEILKFDHRLLSSQISNLLQERMIHKRTKPIVGEGPKERTKKPAYYFVNYKSLVDIVHFKLYRMRQKLEESIEKANQQKLRRLFKCSNSSCRAEFSELHARELYHPNRNQFICVICQNVVEEMAAVDGEEIFMRMAKFNEFTEPLRQLALAASSYYVEDEPETDWGEEKNKSVTVRLVNSLHTSDAPEQTPKDSTILTIDPEDLMICCSQSQEATNASKEMDCAGPSNKCLQAGCATINTETILSKQGACTSSMSKTAREVLAIHESNQDELCLTEYDVESISDSSEECDSDNNDNLSSIS